MGQRVRVAVKVYIRKKGEEKATVEEMVVVTNEGADYLSTPQTELFLI